MVASSLCFLMLSLSLFSQCCIFVFSCAHSNVVASSCFRGLCCCFLVVRAIDLLLWRFLLLLLVLWVFHSTSLVVLLCFGFQNYNHVYVSSPWVQCNSSLFYITTVLALQSLLHRQFFFITNVPTSQIILHCNCSCIIDFSTL